MRLTWENEVQWWWCRRWLCARGLWWPPFWGICGAVGRRYKTLCSSANDADVHPRVLIWSVIVNDSFSRPCLPLWRLLELMFSPQLSVWNSHTAQNLEEKLTLCCLLSLIFLSVVLACDKNMLWSWLGNMDKNNTTYTSVFVNLPVITVLLFVSMLKPRAVVNCDSQTLILWLSFFIGITNNKLNSTQLNLLLY